MSQVPYGRSHSHDGLLDQHRGYEPHDYEYEPPELDEYDRALLAEPVPDRSWWESQAAAPRMSLPPRPSASRLVDHSRTQNEVNDLTHSGVVIYRTPPQQCITCQRPPSAGLFVSSPCLSDSSALGQLPSSPSYQVSQSRRAHEPPRRSNLPTSPRVQKQSRLEITHAGLQPRLGSELATPVVQGIPLVSPSELPDRFRSIFPYCFFNAVQSKCFATVFRSSSNLVLSAPTGSGKTVLLELAVCQLVSSLPNDQLKVIYMAPTKSLCSERYRDWSNKFRQLNLTCGELTGDTDASLLKKVQSASVIITTPEKWDATTRKWKDHFKLMHLVKLFLIDEVHILKESRGASLEAVVSRMKSVGSGMRFIALGATVPNSDDVAKWLGKSSADPQSPASREVFGEEFRPVKLQKHVYGFSSNGNDFAFDKLLDSKYLSRSHVKITFLNSSRLPEIVSKHSAKKPVMIFCSTRKNAESAAKLLAEWWRALAPKDRQWLPPKSVVHLADSDLRSIYFCQKAAAADCESRLCDCWCGLSPWWSRSSRSSHH